MYVESKIILNLYNLTPSKVKLLSIFLEGFLVEIDENRIIVWNLENSALVYSESNKVTFINSKNISKYENYAFISKENLEEFLNLFGQPSIKALNYFSKLEFKPKVSFSVVYLFLVIYYLIFPIMAITIFFKIAFSKNEKSMFNYYHSVNINDELYEMILKNQHPKGLDLQERRHILKNLIPKLIEKEGPWLDLGCGVNSLLVDLEKDKGGEIFLLDPNPMARDAYEKCKDRFKNTKVDFVSGSGEKLPFEDNYFSFIYCGGVIAHVCYLDKFLLECKRVLKPGGLILFDESNEYPRKSFINSLFSIKLKQKINSNNKISQNYNSNPPKDYISNPWAFLGYSTDHFWIFNLEGLVKHLSKFFKIRSKGGMGSYLCNNGSYEDFPLFYSLDLGCFVNLYLDFKNLPNWYTNFMSNIFGDIGVYIYTLCEKKL